MESHPQHPERATTRTNKGKATIIGIHNMQNTLSEPEDPMSSDVESFDEDDMYPGVFQDEAVSDGPDESQSLLEDMVCDTVHIQSP